VLALIGALPTWPYSRGWSYYPSSGVGLIVLILLILLLMGPIYDGSCRKSGRGKRKRMARPYWSGQVQISLV